MPSDHLPGDWFATVTIDPETGEYTFTINQAHDDMQALRPDAPWQGEVTVRVTDDKGAYDEEQVTVTIKGSNDLPDPSAIRRFILRKKVITRATSLRRLVRWARTGISARWPTRRP